MQQDQTMKLWNRSYILVLVTSFLTSLGFFMIAPILVKYVVHLGASVALGGVIAGMLSIVALFARPFAGFLSDLFNKKTILMISTVILAFSILCYGITANLWILIVLRIVHGIAFSFSGTSNTSLSTSFIPKHRLGEGIGFMGVGYIFATAVGPNLGIQIASRYGYQHVFYAAAAVVLFAAFLMSFIRYSAKASGKNATAPGTKRFSLENLLAKELLIYAVLAGFFSLMNGLISSFLVMLGDARHITGVGYYFTVNALVLLFVRPLSGKLLDKKGFTFIAFPAYLLAIAAAVLLGASNALWMILLAGICYALGQGSAQPMLQATCIKSLGPERVGVATSTYYVGADVGQGLGPIIGGTVVNAFGYGTLYYGGGIMLLAGMMILYLHTRKTKRIA